MTGPERASPIPRRLTILAVAGLLIVGLVTLMLGPFSNTCGQLAAFTDSDTDVEVSFKAGEAGTGWLVARFTPTRPGFHLYSKDLPRGGLGFPTLLEIVSGQGVERGGEVSADQVEISQYIEPLGTSVLVYPEGPVTLRMPIIFPSNSAVATAELSVTYEACSSSVCLRPVLDKRFMVVIQAQPSRLALPCKAE